MQISNQSTLIKANPFFSGSIREIELTIVNFFAQVGEWNGRFPKLSEIYAYFLIHQTLTQQQIRKLTGYSKGSVSLYLKLMEEQGLITKLFLEGTHILQYISTSERVKFDYLSKAQNLDDLKVITEFCEEILDNLSKKQSLSSNDSEDQVLLGQRMEDLRYFTQNRITAHNPGYQPIDPAQIPKDQMTHSRVDPNFDAETEEIEALFHRKMIELGVLQADNPKMAEINSYFITRRCLSPKFLIEKTNFSSATVYSNLRFLHEHRFIEKLPTSSAYEMKSVATSFRLYRFHYFSLLTSRIGDFQATQAKLRDPREKLLGQTGYFALYTVIDHILVKLREIKAWLHSQQPLIDKLNAFVKPSREDKICHPMPYHKSYRDTLTRLIAKFRVSLRSLKSRDTAENLKQAEEELDFYLGNEYPIFLALDLNDDVLGYIVIKIEDDVVWAESLYVLESARLAGIGGYLYRKAEEIAQNLNQHTIYNWIHPNNTKIINFLEKRGYDVLNLVEIRKKRPNEMVQSRIAVGKHSFGY